MLARVDQSGELGNLIRTFSAALDFPVVRALLSFAGASVQKMEDLVAESNHLLDSTVGAIVTFSSLGWTPSGVVPVNEYSAALDVYRLTGSLHEAQEQLVKAWNADDRLTWHATRVSSLGVGDDELTDIALRRRILLDKALQHHYAGAYEASVPIVLAQVDGIVFDMTESRNGFFDRLGDRTHLQDHTTIAGIDEGLQALQAVFGSGKGMGRTSASGSMSRHGIMHGRELGYDTLVNSTKAFVLLFAIVEWAQPKARALADKRQDQRDARFAGVRGTDERGRQVDRRGFREAKDSLHKVDNRERSEYRKHKRYRGDLCGMFPGDAGDKLLGGRDEIAIEVTQDSREYWAWRTTPSGFCFGIARSRGDILEWQYAAHEPPHGGPSSDSGWARLPDPIPVDWE